MDRTQLRQKLIAKETAGKILDIGYNQDPNHLLTNVDGYDLNISNKPSNYLHFFSSMQDVPKNHYDTIILGEIIEHIFDLDEFMKFILKSLKNKGKIIITTPNPHYFGDILESWLNKRISDRGHLHSFSKHNLLNLLEHYNLKDIKFKHMYSSLPLINKPIKINLGHLLTQKYMTICWKIEQERPTSTN